MAGENAINGPLRVREKNPRYFTDGSGRAVYLTGSHVWSNLKDMGTEDPPAPLDFGRFNPDYFGRLHDRVAAAGERGIYVSVMLFEGHGQNRTDAGYTYVEAA